MKKHLFFPLVGLFIIMTFVPKKLYSQNQNDKVKLFNLSIQHETKGDIKKAISEIIKIYSGNESNYLINMRLGWLNYQQKSYNDSKKYYEKALSLKKNNIEALLGLTLPLSQTNEWDQIESIYQEVLALDSQNYTANLRLGQIYLNKTEYSNAQKYLEKVYSLYPSEYEPNLSLGWTYYYLGKKSQAAELFTNALMLSENDVSASEGLNLVK